MLDHDQPNISVTFDSVYIEVMQFYAEQMQRLDSGAADEWAATFTEDGTFDMPVLPEPVRGRAQLSAMVRRSAEQLAAAGEVRRHWHGMVAVRPEGDTVAVRCYAMIYATPLGGETRLHRSCVCEDVLVRENGKLEVRDRRVTRDDGFTLPREGFEAPRA